jgi:hypothetical protein
LIFGHQVDLLVLLKIIIGIYFYCGLIFPMLL